MFAVDEKTSRSEAKDGRVGFQLSHCKVLDSCCRVCDSQLAIRKARYSFIHIENINSSI